MRLFLALPLSRELKTALRDIQRQLERQGLRGRAIPEENLHLTLCFLGELRAAQPVVDALETLRFAPFSLTLDGLGCFDELWWVGVRPSKELEALAAELRRSLGLAGLPFDRQRFRPHITILRRASGHPKEPRIPAVSMRAERFVLYRSDQGKAGVHYTELKSFEAEYR